MSDNAFLGGPQKPIVTDLYNKLIVNSIYHSWDNVLTCFFWSVCISYVGSPKYIYIYIYEN